MARCKTAGNMHTLKFAHTEDGWEAWEVFASAEHYEAHAKHTMESPDIGKIFEMMAQWEEVDAWIHGEEKEIARSPKIAEFYPTQKRIFGKPSVHALVPYFGWINENDGADHTKTGGPIVMIYYADFRAGKKDAAVAVLNKIIKKMEQTNDKVNMPVLRFDMLANGYMTTEVLPSVANFEAHCANMFSEEAFLAEMMTLADMIDVTYKRLYCLKADYESSATMMEVKAEEEKVWGTPCLGAYDKQFIGWVKK